MGRPTQHSGWPAFYKGIKRKYSYCIYFCGRGRFVIVIYFILCASLSSATFYVFTYKHFFFFFLNSCYLSRSRLTYHTWAHGFMAFSSFLFYLVNGPWNKQQHKHKHTHIQLERNGKQITFCHFQKWWRQIMKLAAMVWLILHRCTSLTFQCSISSLKWIKINELFAQLQMQFLWYLCFHERSERMSKNVHKHLHKM